MMQFLDSLFRQETEKPNQFQNGILNGMQGKQMYEGTVARSVVTERRAKAKLSRRADRQRRRIAAK
jgi:hypothetical protein